MRPFNATMSNPAMSNPAHDPQSRYVLPVIEERTSYGYKRLDPYTKLYEERIVFLGQAIDDTIANDVISQLIVLESHAAAVKAGSTDPAAIRAALRAEGGNPGITAPMISYAENGGFPVKTVPVIGFKDGKRVLVADSLPSFVPDWR